MSPTLLDYFLYVNLSCEERLDIHAGARKLLKFTDIVAFSIYFDFAVWATDDGVDPT